ncbi:MAG: 2Fe-2S iron-sulfur cluster-binding protein [Fidelibacterota bacterium]
MTVSMVVDDREVHARQGTTLLDAFRSAGIEVPTLCFHDAVSPYAACRLCLVEVTAGKRTMLTASCMYPVTDGIVVQTSSERVMRARRMVAELLLARCPNVPEIRRIARNLGVTRTRFKERDETCVLCGLCVRGCEEIAGLGAITFANRGVHTELVSPFRIPSEICSGCTTCIYLCPTDAVRFGEIRIMESAHPLHHESEQAKCGLCAEYDMISEFRESPWVPS